MNRGGELDGLLPEKENITVNECLPQINSTILHFIPRKCNTTSVIQPFAPKKNNTFM